MKLIKNDELDIKPQALTEAETEKIWQAIRQEITNPAPQPQKFFDLFIFKRQAYIPLTLAALFIVGFGTTSLAQESSPGDFLYPLQRVYENVQLAITPSQEEKSQLVLDFSEKRIDEIGKILFQDLKVAATSTVEALETEPEKPINTPLLNKLEAKPIKHLEKTERALVDTLKYLENNKTELQKTGDSRRAQAVDSLVNQLSEQTKNYLKDLEKVRQSLPEDQKIQNRINQSEREIKRKFKFETNNNQGRQSHDDDDNNEDRDQNERESDTERRDQETRNNN